MRIHQVYRRLGGGIAGAGLALALGLAGCSASNSASRSASSSGERSTVNGQAAEGNKAAAPADQAGGAPVLHPEQVPGSSAQRDIIYTGNITVRVSNVDSAAAPPV